MSEEPHLGEYLRLSKIVSRRPHVTDAGKQMDVLRKTAEDFP